MQQRVYVPLDMGGYKDVVHILQEIDLDDIEKIVSQPYHSDGPGRPPRSPIDSALSASSRAGPSTDADSRRDSPKWVAAW